MEKKNTKERKIKYERGTEENKEREKGEWKKP